MNADIELWDNAYAPGREHSWDTLDATASTAALERAGLTAAHSLVDVGGGCGPLPGVLLDQGLTDVTVVDVSAQALRCGRERLRGRARQVEWVHADLLTWRPDRQFDVWHDRAVFHFLTDPADRRRYAELMHRCTRPGGTVVVATFAADGPEQCTGLPVQRYEPDELAAELRDGLGGEFTVLDARRETHRTPFGTVQPFTWVSLRMALRERAEREAL